MEEILSFNDLYTYVGKSFNGRNLKTMLMIKVVVKPKGMDWEYITSRRVEINVFPLFTKQDTPEILWAYMISYLVHGSDPGVDVHNLPNASSDAPQKRKESLRRMVKGLKILLPL